MGKEHHVSATRNVLVYSLSILAVGGLAACGSSGSTAPGSSSSSSSSSSGSAAPSSSSASGGSGTSSSAASPGGGGSEGSKPPAQVLKDAKSALFNASSVDIKGTVTQQGQQQKLDLRFQGNNTAGTETTSGIVVNIVKVGSKAYIKAPAAFWTKTVGSKAAGLAGKWIESTGSSNVLGSLTLQSIAAGLNSTDSPLLPGVKRTTLDGKKALVLTQKDGSTLTVADATSPVPLQIVNKTAATKGQLDFTNYGSAQTISAPKGAMTAAEALKSQKTTT